MTMRAWLVMSIAVLALSAPRMCEGVGASPAPPVLSLCELVNNWKDHNRQVVRVRAIYAVGAEQAVLYDPGCRDGMDLTYVKFREHTKGTTKRLRQLISKNRRVAVVFEGIFYGPEPQKDIDPNLPSSMKDRLEKSPKHYGHMDSLESMLDVSMVVEAADVVADSGERKPSDARKN
jgi:hypothetical protein